MLKKIKTVFRNILKILGIKSKYKEDIEERIRGGMKVGKNVYIGAGVTFDRTYPYLISIGDNTVIISGARFIAHDASLYPYTKKTRVGKIDIKEDCIISYNATILPGVTIGPRSIVGAGSVVNKDVPPNTCVLGSPARHYASFDDIINHHKKEITKRPSLPTSDADRFKNDPEGWKKAVLGSTKDGNAYIDGLEIENWAPVDQRNYWHEYSKSHGKK